jgi:error-prone DNA polymerase
MVAITGRLQNEAGVIHVVAEQVEDLTPMLALLSDDGRRISALANADELRRPQDRPKANAAARSPPLVQESDAMPKGRNFR